MVYFFTGHSVDNTRILKHSISSYAYVRASGNDTLQSFIRVFKLWL